MKDYKCSYCHGKTTNYTTISGYSLLICSNCSLLQTALSETKLEPINDDVYTPTYIEGYKKREKYISKRFIKRIQEIEIIKPHGKILDIGIGSGLFIKLLNPAKWQIYGIDINPVLVKNLKLYKFAHIKLARINNIYYPFQFDVITCFDVLEHDKSLKKNLKKIHNLLDKNGLLVIQTPNYSGFLPRLLGDKWDWWSVPDHVFHFSPMVLSNILENEKYIIYRKFTWDPVNESVKSMASFVKRSIPNIFKFNAIVSRLLYPTYYIVWFVLQLLNKINDYGSLTVIYAYKK